MKKPGIQSVRNLLAAGILSIPLAAGAQIQTVDVDVVPTPTIDSVHYDCPSGMVSIYSSDDDSGAYIYSVINIMPDSLTLPPDNDSGKFNLTGATSAVLRASSDGCFVDYPIQFNCGGTTLPVDFLAFDARLINHNTGLLEWKVTNEKDVVHYIVEKASDGVHFEKIGLVLFHSSGSNPVNLYQYSDNDLFVGVNYYRIRQVDLNGDSRYSEIRTLTYYPESIPVVLYPNPADEQIYLKCQVQKDSKLSLWVVDNLSRMVVPKQVRQLTKGVNVNSVDISGLADGSYYLGYKLEANNQVQYVKFDKKKGR